MNILLINKSFKTGGAAIAAQRLWKALLKLKINTHFLVYDKYTSDNRNLIILTKSRWDVFQWWFRFIYERLYFFIFQKNMSVRFSISPAISGKNISKLAVVKKSDIIHLHWFNQGFLSLKNVKELADLGKPMVWTLHDMWAFTGGCHYNDGCYNFINGCGNCPYLKKPGKYDLSYRIFRGKENLYKNVNITFVTCSNWLKNEATKAKVLEGGKIIHIPNPINVDLFCSSMPLKIRKNLSLPLHKTFIFFGAANVNDSRKGVKYLIDALNIISINTNIEILLFGKNGSLIADKLPFITHDFGLVNCVEKIIELYQAADLFVLPSLQDNLPNTIMESMSCGTPVVAFKTGGVPEMIDHKKTGYLAEYKSAEDLARGIKWVLENNKDNCLGKAGREKVLREYSEEVVAKQYIKLYESLLNG
ncbi:MAG: glycosyltransferase family 4 protein [Prolixibacteraceae bacterium]|nr:glycosyltransferase family 4 protein [Prolixibacteraceae bacterium]